MITRTLFYLSLFFDSVFIKLVRLCALLKASDEATNFAMYFSYTSLSEMNSILNGEPSADQFQLSDANFIIDLAIVQRAKKFNDLFLKNHLVLAGYNINVSETIEKNIDCLMT